VILVAISAAELVVTSVEALGILAVTLVAVQVTSVAEREISVAISVAEQEISEVMWAVVQVILVVTLVEVPVILFLP
jgi:hypothetical protein